MNYFDGQEVKLGDRLRLFGGPDSFGTVVCDIDSGVGSKEYPIEQWSYLEVGVMILSDDYGLMHHSVSNQCMTLVSRGTFP